VTTARPRTAAATVVLSRSATFWFVVALLGQWVFFYYIAAFYGLSTLQGDFRAWSKNTLLFRGYAAGDTVGNLFFAAHALLAAVIALGGALQLIPQIRARALFVHRWNGRLFLLTAFSVSLTGLYLVWVRGDSPTVVHSLALSLNAVLIITCAALAWRSVLVRDIAAHRRWALRTYIVANGQWFFRVGVFAWVIVDRGTEGLDLFNRYWQFGCYLLPLAVLDLQLRVQDRGGPRTRFAMAGALFALTVLMSVGMVGLYMLVWRPLLAQRAG
jgi:hypothetical protein